METRVEEENSSKTQKILKISIIISVILFVFVLILLFIFMYQDSLTMRVYIDDTEYRLQETQAESDGEAYTFGAINILENNKNTTKNLVAINSEGVIYFSIRTIAEMQGYSYTIGEYLEVSQDTSKCHVTYPNGEDVSFSAGSKEIYKVVQPIENTASNTEVQNTEEQYESYTLNDEVKMINGELYATAETIQIGLNSSIILESDKKIRVYSLKYLADTYGQQISAAGYTPSTVFRNQRALVDGIAVVSKTQSSSQTGAVYGLYSLQNNSNVTDMRFESIEYLQNVNKYIVSSEGKYGIIEVKEENGQLVAKEVIPLEYDNISLLDAQKGLFIIKKLDSYGVIREDGITVVPAEFTSIGIGDITPYVKQGITNQYLLFDKYIPVEKDGKYGMYKLEDYGGRNILETNYLGFGCSNAETVVSSGGNVLIIPEEAGLGFQGIVVQVATGKYGILGVPNNDTQDLAMQVTAIYDSIYSVTKDQVTDYYVINSTMGQPTLLKDVVNSFVN